MHMQWIPDVLRVEKGGFDKGILDGLEAMGHTVEERDPWGNAQTILVNADNTLDGAPDPREGGTARGY